MTTFVAWALVAFLLISTALSIRRAWRGTDPNRNLVTDALSTFAMALLFGFIHAIGWNETIPIALWWLTALLLGILAAIVTYRLLAGLRNGDGVGAAV